MGHPSGNVTPNLIGLKALESDMRVMTLASYSSPSSIHLCTRVFVSINASFSSTPHTTKIWVGRAGKIFTKRPLGPRCLRRAAQSTLATGQLTRPHHGVLQPHKRSLAAALWLAGASRCSLVPCSRPRGRCSCLHEGSVSILPKYGIMYSPVGNPRLAYIY